MDQYKQYAAGDNKSQMFSEIRSHSSILTNDRLDKLFRMLDIHMIELNIRPNKSSFVMAKSVAYQIYKNIRTLLRNHHGCVKTLNLGTRIKGQYLPDVLFSVLEHLKKRCDQQGYTVNTMNKMTEYLNQVEIILRDILQYFSYLYRPEFSQKPDLDEATERYQAMTDNLTLEQLQSVVGENHKLGTLFQDLKVIEQEETQENDDEDNFEEMENEETEDET